MQTSGTTAGLRGIDSVDGTVAWASGSEGTILRTIDGGQHWTRCATPDAATDGATLDFRGVQAFDANTAIVMASGRGDKGRLYKTTDGCLTWKLVFSNPDKDGFWDAIRFFDRDQSSLYSHQYANGVLVGDPVNGIFAIFVTRNGGDNWTRWNENDPKHPPKANVGESLFAASNEAAISPGSNGPFAFVTGGTDARIYLAQSHSPFDAGWWESLSSKDLSFASGKSAGAFAIAARRYPNSPFADFMVVGGDYLQPDALGSAAFVHEPPGFVLVLGDRAIARSRHPPHGFRSAVQWSPSLHAWITVGTNGSDISRDDGRTWRPLDNGNWNALSLPFVVGPDGRIAKLNSVAIPRN
ncbi:MAG TPA: hypothetical protein VND90_10520 [Terracidiphilus sp.]|nr:hypothetical protein [Terracidiphilus sp.]